jgi:hypothetical protein
MIVHSFQNLQAHPMQPFFGDFEAVEQGGIIYAAKFCLVSVRGRRTKRHAA